MEKSKKATSVAKKTASKKVSSKAPAKNQSKKAAPKGKNTDETKQFEEAISSIIKTETVLEVAPTITDKMDDLRKNSTLDELFGEKKQLSAKKGFFQWIKNLFN